MLIRLSNEDSIYIYLVYNALVVSISDWRNICVGHYLRVPVRVRITENNTKNAFKAKTKIVGVASLFNYLSFELSVLNGSKLFSLIVIKYVLCLFKCKNRYYANWSRLRLFGMPVNMNKYVVIYYRDMFNFYGYYR